MLIRRWIGRQVYLIKIVSVSVGGHVTPNWILPLFSLSFSFIKLLLYNKQEGAVPVTTEVEGTISKFRNRLLATAELNVRHHDSTKTPIVTDTQKYEIVTVATSKKLVIRTLAIGRHTHCACFIPKAQGTNTRRHLFEYLSLEQIYLVFQSRNLI